METMQSEAISEHRIVPSSFLAHYRIILDDQGNFVLGTGHACPHYTEHPFAEVNEATKLLMRASVTDDRTKLEADFEKFLIETPDGFQETDEMYQARRQLVGFGKGDDGEVWVAICTDPNCYPSSMVR